MRNPTEPSVELEVAGKTYTLLFNFEAIAAAEDVTGMALISGLHTKEVNAPRISLVRAMLWACLRPHHAEVALVEAGKLVNQHNWSAIWAKVLDCWVAGMKEPEEGEDPIEG